MSRQLEQRGFTSKTVEMSPAAVTLRLRAMAALSTMCLRLGQTKRAGRGDNGKR